MNSNISSLFFCVFSLGCSKLSKIKQIQQPVQRVWYLHQQELGRVRREIQWKRSLAWFLPRHGALGERLLAHVARLVQVVGLSLLVQLAQ
jgi:hypothetical protein